MKKAICAILAAGILAASSVSVFAATGISADEQKIMDALSASITVDGKDYTIPANYIAEAKKYLTNNDVTPTQVNEILGLIDSAKAEIKANGLTADVKASVLSYASKAAAVVGLKVSVNGDTVTITGPGLNGTSSNVIKTTGGDMNMTNAAIAMTAILGVLAAAGYTIRKNHLLEK